MSAPLCKWEKYEISLRDDPSRAALGFGTCHPDRGLSEHGLSQDRQVMESIISSQSMHRSRKLKNEPRGLSAAVNWPGPTQLQAYGDWYFINKGYTINRKCVCEKEAGPPPVKASTGGPFTH